MAVHEQEGAVKCPSCHAIIAGKYCMQCGEKKAAAHDLSLKHFAEETVEGFTHFDNKFWRSIKILFLKPGVLSQYFEVGRKVPYMKPVQLFIVCNLLFFFIVGQSNVFAVKLYNYLTYNNYIRFGTRAAFEKKFGIVEDTSNVAVLFNEKMLTQSKAFIVLFIPVFTLACALLFWKRKKYFSLHLVFATHFFSFLLLYFALFRFLFELPNNYLFHLSPSAFDKLAVGINASVYVVYFTIAARRFYNVAWWRAIASSLLMVVLFIICLDYYRIFLFYKILHSI